MGKKYSEKFVVENESTRKHSKSLLFSIMINYVFMEIENGMGSSLFADDGEIWKFHC